MMREGGVLDELMVEAIRRIRGALSALSPFLASLSTLTYLPSHLDSATGRWRVIALTNNYARTDLAVLRSHERLPQQYAHLNVSDELERLGWTEGAVPPRLRAMFDDFCDSSELGTR